jgi:hypothetical protein
MADINILYEMWNKIYFYFTKTQLSERGVSHLLLSIVRNFEMCNTSYIKTLLLYFL